MLYVISKVGWFVAQPSSLMLLALAFGTWLVWRGAVQQGLRWLTGALAAIVLVGLTAFADVVTLPLEQRFPQARLDGTDYAGIIVLGGMEDPRGRGREIMALNEAGERMTEAAALARRLPGVKLIFSGGPGTIVRNQSGPTDEAAALFEAFGIDRTRLVLEGVSRTTDENARLTRDLLQPKPGQKFLLVTSAWHMPRAIGCFRRHGFEVTAWPVDHRTPGRIEVSRFFGAVPDGLRRVDVMLKEYVGLVAYRLLGRTDALFPGP